jgi:AcrR family transcriptional regulator
VSPRSTTRPLPGQEQLAPAFVARYRRVRIIATLAELVAERGYRAVTVADIVKRAGIARNTFYANFNSKEDCFLAAQSYAMSTALEEVARAAETGENWPERVRAGLAAFLDYVVAEPALARTCMVEALTAGPAAVKCYEESQQAFISLFRLGRDVSPPSREISETLEEAVIGGVFWILHQRLVMAEPEPVSELLPELVEFALTPYLGVRSARETALA